MGNEPPILSYAAPPAALSGVRFWRVGEHLELAPDAVLPDRCIKCNAPSDGDKIPFKVQWVDPAIAAKYRSYRFIPYVRTLTGISRWMEERRSRKTAVIRVGLCSRHKRRRRIGAVVQVATLPFAILAILAGIVLAMTPIMIWGIVLIGLSVVLFIVCGVVTTALVEPPFKAVTMKHGRWTLKGICKEFVASVTDDGAASGSSSPIAGSSSDAAAAATTLANQLRRSSLRLRR